MPRTSRNTGSLMILSVLLGGFAIAIFDHWSTQILFTAPYDRDDLNAYLVIAFLLALGSLISGILALRNIGATIDLRHETLLMERAKMASESPWLLAAVSQTPLVTDPDVPVPSQTDETVNNSTPDPYLDPTAPLESDELDHDTN